MWISFRWCWIRIQLALCCGAYDPLLKNKRKKLLHLAACIQVYFLLWIYAYWYCGTFKRFSWPFLVHVWSCGFVIICLLCRTSKCTLCVVWKLDSLIFAVVYFIKRTMVLKTYWNLLGSVIFEYSCESPNFKS